MALSHKLFQTGRTGVLGVSHEYKKAQTRKCRGECLRKRRAAKIKRAKKAAAEKRKVAKLKKEAKAANALAKASHRGGSGGTAHLKNGQRPGCAPG